MRLRAHEKTITLFSFFTATCFTITVFAAPFYVLGAGADVAFRISALWLLASIPFGCAIGRHLRRRNESALCALREVLYAKYY